MSRLFSNTTDRITQGTVDMPATGSLFFWYYPTWAQTDGVDHIFFDWRNDARTQLFTLQHYSDNTLYCGWKIDPTDYRVSVASGSYTQNQNAWNSMLLTWDDTANETKLYLNGSQIGSTATSLVTFSGIAELRGLGNYRGAAGDGDHDCRSRMAELAIWSSVIAGADITSLNGGDSPGLIQPGTLVDYLKLLGTDSPEPNETAGDDGTILSGTSQADHPTINYGGGSLFLPGNLNKLANMGNANG